MKAFLIVDVPNDWNCKEWCIEGDLMGKNEKGYWMFCNEIVEKPLKPMPEKKNPTKKWVKNNEDVAEAMKIGWNACIEEIEK